MEKVNHFFITNITANGFKKFDAPVTLDFGAMNSITGGNRQGKSSIADMVAYVFTGASFSGGQRESDRLQNDTASSIQVAVTYLDDRGTYHTLSRCRSADGTSSVTLDDIPIRQSSLVEMFGDVHTFLAMLNPAYLIEILDGKEAKDIIEPFLPQVSHDAILAHLSTEEAELLRDQSIPVPEIFRRNKRKEISVLEEALSHLDGRIAATEAFASAKEAELAPVRAELASAEVRITELEDKRDEGRQDYTAELDALRQQYQTLEAASSSDTTSLADILSAMVEKLAETAQMVYTPATQEAIDIEREQYALNAAYEQLKLTASALSGGHCPICKSEIGAEGKQELTAYLRSTQARITNRWQELKLLHRQAKDAESLGRFAFEREQTEKQGALHQLIVDTEASLSHSANPKALLDLHQRITSLSWIQEHGLLNEDEAAELNALRTQKHLLEQHIASSSDSGATIAAHREEREQVEDKISLLQRMIAAVTIYSLHRTRLLFSDLALNRVQIQLMDVTKSTGEVKEAFRFTYDGRDYRKLSMSERICAGLEVCEIMKQLTGRIYPTFVDNYESVEEIQNVRPSGQYFFMTVRRKEPLNVTIHQLLPSAELKKAS